MKVYIGLKKLDESSILARPHGEIEFVTDPSEADFVISDKVEVDDVPHVLVTGHGKVIDLPKIGVVPLVNVKVNKDTLFVGSLEMKSDRVSFTLEGTAFGVKNFSENENGQIIVTVGEKEYVLRVSQTQGFAKAGGVVEKSDDDEGDRPTDHKKKRENPMHRGLSGDLGDVANGLLEGVSDDELSGKVKVPEAYSANGEKTPTVTVNIPDTMGEIKSEEDLLGYAGGILG